MKFLSIKLKNLNSLQGEWNIDLTQKDYTLNGIFAITGPTGAGKTTIFDAVCLALYGRTPRLEKVSGGTNEIMSHGTNECYAHVTFSTDEGIFTSKWGQHKSRGKLSSPEHHLIKINNNSESGITISSSSKETVKEIIRLTGMDFNRFTKAMMLEQNGFDAFLEADKNNRAEVLELITGTEIYSIISMKVFERKKDEDLLLRDKINQINTLSSQHEETTEQSLILQIETCNAQLSRLDSIHKKTSEQRDTLKSINKLKTDIERKNEDISQQQIRIDNFSANIKILESAQKAQKLSPDYSTLLSLRESKIKSEKQFKDIQEKISSNQTEFLQLEQNIPAMKTHLAELRGTVLDEAVEVFLIRLQNIVENYNAALQEKNEIQNDLFDLEKNLRELSEKINSVERTGKAAKLTLHEAEENYTKAFDLFMQMSERTEAAVISETREKLMPGTPCPVCGSTEHPGIIHDNIPEIHEDSKKLLSQTEKLNAEVKKLRAIADKAKSNLDKARNEWLALSNEQKSLQKQSISLNEKLSEKQQKINSLMIEINKLANSIGISGDSKPQKIITLVNQWAEKVKHLEEEINESEKKKITLEAVIDSSKVSLSSSNDELNVALRELKEFEEYFITQLRANGFVDENDFISAKNNIDYIDNLREKHDELISRMNLLTAEREKLVLSLNEITSGNEINLTVEEIEKIYDIENQEIIALNKNIAVLNQKIENLRALKAKLEVLNRELDEQKETVARWKALNDLIGSANGDKFRVIAQKITLNLVVNNANEYLRKMNGRYTLILTPENDNLDLSVRDREHGGEIRPTSNLSGGERFIISLALALGLSQISGSKARVDSLFLDEGFGSLDDDSLNTALEALGEVRREGRMIGVISHVAALKELIAAKINVIPKHKGTSIIEGPGCSGS